MPDVLQIPAPMVSDVWHRAEPMLVEPVAMTKGRFETDDVRVLCERGQMQLWLIADGELLAAAVTEIVDYPRKRVARIVFAGGKEARKWQADLDREIEAWARKWGCSGHEAFGRRGWSRIVNAEEAATLIWREYAPEANAATSEGIH